MFSPVVVEGVEEAVGLSLEMKEIQVVGEHSPLGLLEVLEVARNPEVQETRFLPFEPSVEGVVVAYQQVLGATADVLLRHSPVEVVAMACLLALQASVVVIPSCAFWENFRAAPNRRIYKDSSLPIGDPC